MSKNNNVNPGQYKVAGRERPGEDIVTPVEKAELKQAHAKQEPPAPPASGRPQSEDAAGKDRP